MARDEDLDFLKALRLCALGAVKEKDPEYNLRFIFRWYSREFHTPMADVEAMPLEEVLMHFFECRYENMDDEELEQEEARLAETREERLAREEKERLDALDDDEFFQDVKAESDAHMAQLKTRSLDDAVEDPDLDRPVLLPIMGEKLPQAFRDIVAELDPKLKAVPPEVKIEFVSEDELGDLDSWDVLGPPKPRSSDG